MLRWGTCTLGVSADERGGYRQTSKTGLFMWGPPDVTSIVDPPFTQLERNLTDLGDHHKSPGGRISMQWVPTMRWAVRNKWLFNTVINTLCARDRLQTNGELLPRLPEMQAYFAEAWALGMELFQEKWPFSESDVWSGLCKLVDATAANENSMARDVRLGRKTEIDFLAGLARKYGNRFPLLVAAADEIDGR